MAEDNNTRWKSVAPFDVAPQPPQKPTAAPEPDRSWMPAPTVNTIGGVEWHKRWRESWKSATTWCEQYDRVFHSKLTGLESTLAHLERTEPAYSPKLNPARAAVSRCYVELNARYDAYTKSLPFVRY